MSPGEVLASFVAQFYDDKPAPRLVLLSHEIEDAELMAAALSTSAEQRVEIHAPQRGERRQLIEYVLRNAKEALGRRLADTASQQKLLVVARAGLRPEKPPRRVEVYDNSHIMGANAVGAMIVAGAQRLHEAALPHLQHEVGGPEARRRLRHDARDAAAALRAARAGGAAGTAAEAVDRRADPSSRRAPARCAPRCRSAGCPQAESEDELSRPGPISCSSTAAGASSRPRARRSTEVGVRQTT